MGRARSHVKVAFCVLAVVLLTVPLVAEAQPAGRGWRVGWLSSGTAASDPDLREAFQETLRQLGYTEGRSVSIVARYAEGRPRRLREFASELVQLRVDVLVVNGTPAAVAAKEATGEIPIVLGSVADPIGSGLISSLARPGGNVTGVSTAFSEIAAKWLELLREVVPGIERVGFLANPDNPGNRLLLKHVQAAAGALGVTITSFSATTPGEVGRALLAMTQAHVQGAVVPGDAVIRSQRKEIADFATRARLPAVYVGTDYVDVGGLISYGPNRRALGRQVAVYVDRVLKGRRPADLPVEEPTMFELAINLKTAKALRLTIPPSVLLRADRVVE
jgi:putative ABC transport system substrate-binding protein